jgi:hypothetical protein
MAQVWIGGYRCAIPVATSTDRHSAQSNETLETLNSGNLGHDLS